MAKKISVSPVNEIDIEFTDGVKYTATFNMRAVRYMQEELGNIKDVAEIPIEHFGAIVLYAGIKANNPDFQMQEANAIALSMNPNSLQEVISAYLNENAVDEETEESISKKIIAQILTEMAK